MAFYNDHVAAEFISELENLNYAVPRDVAVIGFDNSYVSELMHITTVDYAIQYQAENSFIYLYNQLNQTNIPEKLTVRLVERRTVPKRPGRSVTLTDLPVPFRVKQKLFMLLFIFKIEIDCFKD